MTTPRPLTVPVQIVAELPWAWEHQCGHLQRGSYAAGTTCAGCRFETKPTEVEMFLMVTTVAKP